MKTKPREGALIRLLPTRHAVVQKAADEHGYLWLVVDQEKWVGNRRYEVTETWCKSIATGEHVYFYNDELEEAEDEEG